MAMRKSRERERSESEGVGGELENGDRPRRNSRNGFEFKLQLGKLALRQDAWMPRGLRALASCQNHHVRTVVSLNVDNGSNR